MGKFGVQKLRMRHVEFDKQVLPTFYITLFYEVSTYLISHFALPKEFLSDFKKIHHTALKNVETEHKIFRNIEEVAKFTVNVQNSFIFLKINL